MNHKDTVRWSYRPVHTLVVQAGTHVGCTGRYTRSQNHNSVLFKVT